MTLLIPSEDTIVALHQLNPSPSDLVPPPIFDYQPEHIFVLDRTLFAKALATTSHLSSDELFGMVYEHLSGCFIPEDPSSGFLKLFQVVILVRGDIPWSMVLMLGVNRLLVMAKDTGGLHPIIVREMFL
jgi:hypothetical protein